MLRPTTTSEQQRFKGYFQHLQLSRPMVTGETSLLYNSVAWSLGVTDRWLWPGSNLNDFDQFYELYGYKRSAFGNIALWGHHKGAITHASVQVQGQELWESKCGADLRIRHERRDLAGTLYGKILAYYEAENTPTGKLPEPIMAESSGALELSKKDKLLLRGEIKHLPRKTIMEFSRAFEDWQNSWFAGKQAVLSNSFLRANSVEYFRLLKMGEEIVPLLVQKLSEKENYFAASLYEKICRSDLPPGHDSFITNHEYFVEGEQGKACRTLLSYFETRFLKKQEEVIN